MTTPSGISQAVTAYLARTDAVATAAVELAVVLSPAAFVEPALLRAVRREALPHLEVEAEADLWFSPLVRDRSPEGISFEPGAVAALRERLLAWLSDDRLRPRAQRAAILILSREATELRMVAERITWWSLEGGDSAGAQISAELAPVLDALRSGSQGHARWARRTLPALPVAARQVPDVWEAAARASFIGGTAVDVGTPSADAFDAMTIDLPRVELPIRRTGHTLELGRSRRNGPRRSLCRTHGLCTCGSPRGNGSMWSHCAGLRSEGLRSVRARWRCGP